MLFEEITRKLNQLVADQSFDEDTPRALQVKKAVAFLFLIWPISIPQERREQFGNELQLIANVAAHSVSADFLQYRNTEQFKAFIVDIVARVEALGDGTRESLALVRERWVREQDPAFSRRVILMRELLQQFQLPDGADWIAQLAACFDLVRFAELQVEQGEQHRARIIAECLQMRGGEAPAFFDVALCFRNRLRHGMSAESLQGFIQTSEQAGAFDSLFALVVPEGLVISISQVKAFLQGEFESLLLDVLQQDYEGIEEQAVVAKQFTRDRYGELVAMREHAMQLVAVSVEFFARIARKYGVEAAKQPLEPPEEQQRKAIAEQAFLQSMEGTDAGQLEAQLAQIQRDIEGTVAAIKKIYQTNMVDVLSCLVDHDSPQLAEFVTRFARQLYLFEPEPGIAPPFVMLCAANVPVAIIKSYVANSGLSVSLVANLHRVPVRGSTIFLSLLQWYATVVGHRTQTNFIEMIGFLLEKTFVHLTQAEQMQVALGVFEHIDHEEIRDQLLLKLFALKPDLLLLHDGTGHFSAWVFKEAERYPESVCKILQNPVVVMPGDRFDIILHVVSRLRELDVRGQQGLFAATDTFIQTPACVVTALLDHVDVLPHQGDGERPDTFERVIDYYMLRELRPEQSKPLDERDWQCFRALALHPKMNLTAYRRTRNEAGRVLAERHVLWLMLDCDAAQLALRYLDAWGMKSNGNIVSLLEQVAICGEDKLEIYGSHIYELLRDDYGLVGAKLREKATDERVCEFVRKLYYSSIAQVKLVDSQVKEVRLLSVRDAVDEIIETRLKGVFVFRNILTEFARGDDAKAGVARAVFSYEEAYQKGLARLANVRERLEQAAPEDKGKIEKIVVGVEAQLAAMTVSQFYRGEAVTEVPKAAPR